MNRNNLKEKMKPSNHDNLWINCGIRSDWNLTKSWNWVVRSSPHLLLNVNVNSWYLSRISQISTIPNYYRKKVEIIRVCKETNGNSYISKCIHRLWQPSSKHYYWWNKKNKWEDNDNCSTNYTYRFQLYIIHENRQSTIWQLHAKLYI